MPEWQSSQSPVVALFTRRKSNKLQKVCVAHAMKMAQIQPRPKTNHVCLKYEFPITVLTWIVASSFLTVRDRTYSSVEVWPLLFMISFLHCLSISWPLADLSVWVVGPNVYCQVRQPCRTVVDWPVPTVVCGIFGLINTDSTSACWDEWPTRHCDLSASPPLVPCNVLFSHTL